LPERATQPQPRPPFAPGSASAPAQELLALLAGKNALPGADAKAGKKCRTAWAVWWQANRGSVDLTRLDAAFRPAKTFLATLKEAAYAGHHTLGKGFITGEPGEPLISVQGKKYPKGLGTHPLSDGVASAKYELRGKWSTFSAVAAINDTGGPSNPLLFKVIGDNRVLWQSRPLQNGGQSQECRVDIAGVRLLELQVSCPGNWSNAHAVWLDPCISRLERWFKKR
jgi:hypothetical protein